jgi:hypothetical protein
LAEFHPAVLSPRDSKDVLRAPRHGGWVNQNQPAPTVGRLETLHFRHEFPRPIARQMFRQLVIRVAATLRPGRVSCKLWGVREISTSPINFLCRNRWSRCRALGRRFFQKVQLIARAGRGRRCVGTACDRNRSPSPHSDARRKHAQARRVGDECGVTSRQRRRHKRRLTLSAGTRPASPCTRKDRACRLRHRYRTSGGRHGSPASPRSVPD